MRSVARDGAALSTGAPVAAITRGEQHVDVFALGQDGQLYGRWWG
jgi:hypothetical protein